MSEIDEKMLWAGVDWGDSSHAVCVVDERGDVVAAFTAESNPDGLDEVIAGICAFGVPAGVAVETPRGMLVHKLLEAGLKVFPINPKVAKAWRDGIKAATPKTDDGDAFSLADGLRHHCGKFRALVLDDSMTRELAMLCDDEVRLTQERTALVLRLMDALKEYHPAALEWFRDWTSPSSWDFVLMFPTADSLASASKKKLTGFLAKRNIGISPLWQERISNAANAARWPCDPAVTAAKSLMAVTIAKQLRVLQISLGEYRARIEKLFSEHPDSDIFTSLPGAGPKLAPRLLSSLGSNRSAFATAESLQALSGTVPVPFQSGKTDLNKFRRACDKDFRNTMFQFAQCSIRSCSWAKAFYHRAKSRGQSHALAIRNLGAKWLKIIHRMWMTGQTYDESVFIRSLVKHNSPIVSLLSQQSERM